MRAREFIAVNEVTHPQDLAYLIRQLEESRHRLDENAMTDYFGKLLVKYMPEFPNKLLHILKSEARDTKKMIEIYRLKRQGKATSAQIKWMQHQFKDVISLAVKVTLTGALAYAATSAGAEVVVDPNLATLSSGAMELIAHKFIEFFVEFGIDKLIWVLTMITAGWAAQYTTVLRHIKDILEGETSAGNDWEQAHEPAAKPVNARYSPDDIAESLTHFQYR
jgi:hypothetical protein